MLQIINNLQKITLKNSPSIHRQNSIFAENFRKSAKISVSDPLRGVKKGVFWGEIGSKSGKNEILFH